MDDILVEIYLPVTGKAYDVILPKKCKMYEVTHLVSKAVSELSEGTFIPSDDTIICDRASGAVFNINLSVEELDLTNGSKLMLI